MRYELAELKMELANSAVLNANSNSALLKNLNSNSSHFGSILIPN